METIKSAAIKDLVTNEVYTGRTHAIIMQNMVQVHNLKPPVDSTRFEQGFITNENRFVSRGTAAKIAFAAFQIHREVNILYSEDIL